MDTIARECICCETVGDCIEGLCLACAEHGFKLQKQSDLLTLGLLQEKGKVKGLLEAGRRMLKAIRLQSPDATDAVDYAEMELEKAIAEAEKE